MPFSPFLFKKIISYITFLKGLFLFKKNYFTSSPTHSLSLTLFPPCPPCPSINVCVRLVMCERVSALSHLSVSLCLSPSPVYCRHRRCCCRRIASSHPLLRAGILRLLAVSGAPFAYMRCIFFF